MEVTFDFEAELWEWDARNDSSWVFVTLPLEVADEIRDLVPDPGGFGSVRVKVRCGATSWATSVFPSKETGSFVLPVKKAVRTKAKLSPGDTGAFELSPVLY